MGHGGRLAPLRRAALRAFRNWRLAARRTDHELLTEPTFHPLRTHQRRSTGRPAVRSSCQRNPARHRAGLLHLPIPAAMPPPVPSRHVGKQENGLDLVSV